MAEGQCGKTSSATTGLVELTRTGTTVALGTSSCSSSSRFAATVTLRLVTPVTLPPGRLRLSTRPRRTGLLHGNVNSSHSRCSGRCTVAPGKLALLGTLLNEKVGSNSCPALPVEHGLSSRYTPTSVIGNNGEIFYTLREAQIVIESWRRHYNTIRPHASIGYKPPAPEVFEARIRRVAGCATPTGSDGHAGATANLKLTFHLDHSAGAIRARSATFDSS